MTDTIETLRSRIDSARKCAQEACRLQVEAIDDLSARVAAFEKAQKRVEEEEPPAVPEHRIKLMESSSLADRLQPTVARRLIWCERELARLKDTTTVYGVPYAKAIEAIKGYDDARAELARLREGLKVQEGDMPDKEVDWLLSVYSYSTAQWRAIREIKRHRALLKDGGGK